MLPYLDKMCNVLHCISFAPCNTNMPLTVDTDIGQRVACAHQLSSACNCARVAYHTGHTMHQSLCPRDGTAVAHDESQVGRALQLKQSSRLAEPAHSRRDREQNL